MRERWNRKSFSIRSTENREANLSDILLFVDQEATLASDPLFSKEAMKEREDFEKPQQEKSFKRLKSFGTKLSCEHCNSDHSLEKCFSFRKLKPREKIQLIMKKRLCYSCLENGHQSKDCTSQKTCKSCNELHPTCLHNIYDRSNSKPKSVSDSCPDKSDVSYSVKPSPVTTKSDEIKPDVKVKKSFNTSCSNSINMCIVPVVVRHENSKFDFKTFALLDSCSQGTFICFVCSIH